MKRSAAYPSQYLCKDDLAKPLLLTIGSVELRRVGGEDGEEKPVMHFREDVKSFIVNQTNWITIESAYGDESDHWAGKQIVVFYDPTIAFKGRRTGGVRVRVPDSAPVTPPVAAPVAVADDSGNPPF